MGRQRTAAQRWDRTLGIFKLLLVLSFIFIFPTEVALQHDETDPGGLIQDMEVRTGQVFRWERLAVGVKMYQDREYVYKEVPEALRGHLTLVPFNGAKYIDAVDVLIRFKVRVDVTIFVIYSTHYANLGQVWLNDAQGWKLEPFTCKTDLAEFKSVREIRSRFVHAGSEIELGGNGCVSSNCDTYTVVIVPKTPCL